jgi:heme A synthase
LLSSVSGAVAALGDTLFPASSLSHALEQDLSPTAHLLIRLRLFHPGIAVGAGLLCLGLALNILGDHLTSEVDRFARWTAGLVFVQVLAGLLNVLMLAPVWLQVVHLLVADLLWIAFLLLGSTALAQRGVYSNVPPRPLPSSKALAPS